MNIYWTINKIKQNFKEIRKKIETSRKERGSPWGPPALRAGGAPILSFSWSFYLCLDFLNILLDFIGSSIDVHDLPNVLEARKIRKLVPKHDVSLRVFCDMAPQKKKDRKTWSPEARKNYPSEGPHHYIEFARWNYMVSLQLSLIHISEPTRP